MLIRNLRNKSVSATAWAVLLLVCLSVGLTVLANKTAIFKNWPGDPVLDLLILSLIAFVIYGMVRLFRETKPRPRTKRRRK